MEAQFPKYGSPFETIPHSHQYGGKRALIIGAYISALEITNEQVNNGATVYQSAKDTRVDFRHLSNNNKAEKVTMVAEFTMDNDHHPDRPELGTQPLDDDSPIPGKAVLQDGRVLENIDHVIIATGSLTSFPFLSPLLEQPDTTIQDTDETVITTADGRTMHSAQ